MAPSETAAEEIYHALQQYCEIGSSEAIASADTRQFSEYGTGEKRRRWYEVIFPISERASVQRNGLQLTLQQLGLMNETQIDIFVRDVISWLEHQECTDMNISFSSEPTS